MSDIFDDIMNFHGGIDFKEKMREKAEAESSGSGEKLKPSEKLLADIGKAGFNMSQMEEVLKTRGNQLVISCAGSGKTTTLVFKILYDLKTGYATRVVETAVGGTVRVTDKIWVCTFLRTGAEDLRSSFKRWVAKMGMPDVSDAIQFSTIHAEFSRALKQYGFNKPIIDSSLNSKYLKEVVSSYHLKNELGNSLNADNYRDLEGALTYTRNRLDEKRYDKEIYDELGISATLVDAILMGWKQKRVENGFIDYDDMQELIYSECYEKHNEGLINFIANRYNFLYIDEFQDTSQLQYEVLKLYCRDCKQIFAIGDDDQTIYTWRGSDNSIITTRFPEDFYPTINQLAINYRCPSKILNAIIPSIENNKNRYDKPLQSSVEGGEVRLLEGTSYSDMAEKLVDGICADLNKGQTVAILCRVNTDGLLPAMLLDKINKFAYSISGEGMTLNSYIGTTALSIIKLFTERSTPAVKRALNCLAWDSYGINNLMTVCKTNKLSIWDIDEKDLAYSCPSIAERLITWRNYRKNNGDMRALKYVLQDYRTRIFVKDSQFNLVMRSMLTTIESLLEYSGNDTVEDFLYDLEYMNERLKARVHNDRCFVKIVTVHEFKGKEADSVYIWNDSEDVFPIKKSMGSESQLEEERRIHYIACTRAKKKSTIVYLKNKKGMFVEEMDLSEAGMLSGSKAIMGTLKNNLEEEGNMQRFINSGVEDDESSESEFVSGIVPGVNAPCFDDNEFWGSEE